MADDCGEIGGLVMVDGPGWDSSPLEGEPAISRFNRMAMDNPIYGHNDILDTMSKFDNSKFYAIQDDEPELDEFVQTLWLDGVEDHGYNVDGDPYGEFKKGYDGPAPETGESMYPELAAQNAAEFISQFGKIFAGNNN
jgi:hypothetical protein